MKVFLTLDPADLGAAYRAGIFPSSDGIRVYRSAADAVKAGKEERLQAHKLYYLNFNVLCAELPEETVSVGLDGQMIVKQYIPVSALCSREQLGTLIR